MISHANFVRLAALLIGVAITSIGITALSIKVWTSRLNIIRRHYLNQNTALLWAIGLLLATWWQWRQKVKRERYKQSRSDYRSVNPLLTKSKIDGDHLLDINDIKGKPMVIFTEK